MPVLKMRHQHSIFMDGYFIHRREHNATENEFHRLGKRDR